MTGVEAFQCLRAPSSNRQASSRAGGIFVSCSMQSSRLHVAPVNTLFCFASRRKCTNRSLLQVFRGQNCRGAVPRGRGTHHPGHPRGAALHLHLRGSCQTQGTEQENNVYPGHPAAQPGLLVAQDWGPGERGVGERGRKVCWFVSLSPPRCVSAISPLSEWLRHSHWKGYGCRLKGKVVLLTQCHWFKMQ